MNVEDVYGFLSLFPSRSLAYVGPEAQLLFLVQCLLMLEETRDALDSVLSEELRCMSRFAMFCRSPETVLKHLKRNDTIRHE